MNATPHPSSPLPIPPIIMGGYQLATLFVLGNWEIIKRFEVYRASRARAPYFEDPAVSSGDPLPSDRPGCYLVDQADLDELERAFFCGAACHSVEGIRIPWHETERPRPISQEMEFLSRYFSDRGYTVWPSTHALVAIEHAYIKLLVTILSAEQSAQDPA